jgi:hypothetical protein
MQADGLRWAMVRLTVPCSQCGTELGLHAPQVAVDCDCGATTRIEHYPQIGSETGAPLDALVVGEMRQRGPLTVGRQAPACGQCGQMVPLSAADLGQSTSIRCPSCDATTFTWPAPEWLQSYLLGAQQIYASCLPGREPPVRVTVEPVWIRCAACETGMRIDEHSERLTRCGACHALNHVPDPVWQALHPRRSSGAWYVLFETLTPAERRQRTETEYAIRAAIQRLGQPVESRQIATDIKALQRAGGVRGEQTLGDALRCDHQVWFETALAALSGMPGMSVTRRLGEALDELKRPERRLAIARRLAARDRQAAVQGLIDLTDNPPASVAAEALEVLASLDAEQACEVARRVIPDAALGLRRVAVRVLIRAGQTRLGQAALPLLDHHQTAVQQRAVRLVMGDERSIRAALLGLLGQDVAIEVEAALKDAPSPYPEAVLSLARGTAARERMTATRWLRAVGWAQNMGALYADLPHQTDAVALHICDAITAKSAAERSLALTRLLDAPTLKLRLDAANLLAEEGLPGALEKLDDLAGGWFTNRDLKAAADKAARAIRWRVTQGTSGGLSVHEAGNLTLKDGHD